MNGTLTDVPGLLAGHYTDAENGTGCTVVLTPPGTTGGVDVRGAAPGTRETDLLRSENTVAGVNGVALSGGSAYGLGSADGVMRFLEERGVGHPVGGHIVPIVPAAIIFDLGVGNGMVRPTAAEGYAASEAATHAPCAAGLRRRGYRRDRRQGAGTRARHEGWRRQRLARPRRRRRPRGADRRQRRRRRPRPRTPAALLAGSRGADGAPIESTTLYASHDYGRTPAQGPSALGNTTIGVVATNLRLTKAQANRLATLAHDGLALAIRPAHTPHDGDTMFALATCGIDAPEEFTRLCALTPSVVARAVVSAVEHATDLHGYPAYRSMSHG